MFETPFSTKVSPPIRNGGSENFLIVSSGHQASVKTICATDPLDSLCGLIGSSPLQEMSAFDAFDFAMKGKFRSLTKIMKWNLKKKKNSSKS